MRRILWFFPMLLLWITGVAGAQSAPVFRIGVLDAVDGPITRGAQLAVRAINADGGVRGADGTFFLLELVIEPVGQNGALENAAAALRNAEVVAVLGPDDSNLVLNNLPALQALNLPVIITATGDTLLAADNSGRLFRARAAEVIQGRALADYLIKDAEVSSVAAVQIGSDLSTQAALVGFTTAASALGVSPAPVVVADEESSLTPVIEQLATAAPSILVAYGDPSTTARLFTALRNAGWPGAFAYNQALDPAFRDGVPLVQQTGILGTTTWPYTGDDPASRGFRDAFIDTFGAIPGAVEAAAFDAVTLIGQAIQQPGELGQNLQALDNVIGAQGLLRPAQLQRGETTDYVAVIRLNEFGAPQVLARYSGSQRVGAIEPVGPLPSVTPAPSPTPQGVVATITRTVQNVRSGPGTNYPILGELRQGDQVQVIGANIDFSWLVISFRGQNGWLSRGILETFGDLNTLPIIAPPPTPTPAPTATPLPQPDIVIDAASGAPTPFIVNQPFSVSVTVRNAGSVPAGQFAVAATFPPNNIYAAAIVPGLGPGQSTIAVLSDTFSNTGFYSVAIVADLNNEVAESNEQNNVFSFNYGINKPILRSGSQTLNIGDTIDLEGNAVQGDANWNGVSLNVLGTAQLGLIPNVNISTIHWDLINPAVVNQPSIPAASLVPGAIIGIITADGNRGILRVDSFNGSQLGVTFLVYQN